MKRRFHKIRTKELLRKIGGVQTIKSIRIILKVNRRRAIYLVYRLRKEGYVTTKQDSDNSRIYFISKENLLGGNSYINILNKYSPLKLISSEVYKIYGREISIEEVIIYAIKTHKFRYVLSSLALFRKIKNWGELYRLAKKNDLLREVGALYNLVETNFPRVRKIGKKFLYFSLPHTSDRFRYIIPNLKSKDYCSIEKKWKVYIPFNKKDLVGGHGL